MNETRVKLSKCYEIVSLEVKPKLLRTLYSEQKTINWTSGIKKLNQDSKRTSVSFIFYCQYIFHTYFFKFYFIFDTYYVLYWK